MKFLLDESAEYRISDFLQAQGHDVTAIAHDHPASLADVSVLAIAVSEGRIVITNDADFGDLVFRDKQRHAGVILFRMPAGNTTAKIDRLRTVLEERAGDLENFVVVEAARVRVRRSD